MPAMTPAASLRASYSDKPVSFAAAQSCRERPHEGANRTGLTLLMPPFFPTVDHMPLLSFGKAGPLRSQMLTHF